MLFLLRKNRRTLMAKNKITTYIAYAVGEIILVVIGILIAVWINRTNHRKVVGIGVLKMIGQESNLSFGTTKNPYLRSAANDSSILERLNSKEPTK